MALKESKKLEQANSYELVVTVDGETFEKALNTVYKKEVKKINIPGFRKGKAPRHIIEKMYGKEVFYDDAMQDCYPEALYNAAEEAGVKIVTVESIEVTEVENGFTFKANIVVEPDMEINNYLGFEVTKKSTEVTDELIDEEIEKVRDRNSRMVTVEDRPVANGDIAVIDFEGFVDGVAFDGGKAEKYQAEELAGKDAEFKIKLHEIKAKELPEVDDEFVKDVSEKETVAEYRDELKETIAARLEDEAEKDKDNQIAEKLIELLEGEIPQAMYDNQVNEMVRDFEMRIRSQGIDMNTYLQYMGIDLDGLKKMYADEAKKRVQLRLALETIAKKENIEVTDADLDEAYNKMAEAYKVDVETVKGAVPAETLTLDVKAEKALNMVKDSVVIK